MRNAVWRIDGRRADATAGEVVWAPAKSLWNTTMFALALGLGPLFVSASAVLLFVVTSYVALLLGHSVGMHRRLIHRTYDCPKPLERVLVWLGVMVGMAGPLGILRIHDVRDWAQREPVCHDFFAHRRGLLRDAFWQLRRAAPRRPVPRPAVASEPQRPSNCRFASSPRPVATLASRSPCTASAPGNAAARRSASMRRPVEPPVK